MYISNFSLFYAIFQVIQCVSLIFNFFQFCRHFSRSYSVNFSYSTFFRFLAIFQVLECPFLIFHFFHCFSHFPAPTVCVSPVPRFSVFSPYSRCSIVCVSFYMFFRFLSIFQVLPWFSHVSPLSVFLTYSRSLHYVFLIFQVFQVSRNIPGTTVGISHLLSFSVLLAIFQVLQCEFLIFHVCHFSRQNPGPIVCIFHISHVSLFLPIFQVLQSVFLFLHVFHSFLSYFMS